MWPTSKVDFEFLNYYQQALMKFQGLDVDALLKRNCESRSQLEHWIEDQRKDILAEKRNHEHQIHETMRKSQETQHHLDQIVHENQTLDKCKYFLLVDVMCPHH
jgi:BioD-like phosphotransacetylase family protein